MQRSYNDFNTGCMDVLYFKTFFNVLFPVYNFFSSWILIAVLSSNGSRCFMRIGNPIWGIGIILGAKGLSVDWWPSKKFRISHLSWHNPVMVMEKSPYVHDCLAL